MPRLTDILDERATVLDALATCETLEERSAIQDQAREYINELTQAAANKVEAYMRYEALDTATIQAIKDEVARLQARARGIEAAQKWRKQTLLLAMADHKLENLKGLSGSIARQKNADVVQIDENALPDAYRIMTVVHTPAKDRIKEALDRGEVIPGVTVVDGGEHIRFHRSRAK